MIKKENPKIIQLIPRHTLIRQISLTDRKLTQTNTQLLRFPYGAAQLYFQCRCYMAGGMRQFQALSYFISFSSFQVNFLNPLLSGRMNLSLTGLDGHVYSSGGQSKNVKSSTVQYYVTKQMKWRSLPRLNNPAYNHSSLVTNQKYLYIFCGYFSPPSVEKLRLDEPDKFDRIQSNISNLVQSLPVCLGSEIALFGGIRYQKNAVFISDDQQTRCSSLSKVIKISSLNSTNCYRGSLWVIDNQDYLYSIKKEDEYKATLENYNE